MNRSIEGLPTMPVTDCFGAVRQGWFDGERLECPFCQSVSVGDRCENPGCQASSWARPEVLLGIFHERALREEEERRRRRLHEWSMERIREENREREEWQKAVAEEAQAKGTCVRCALDSIRYGSPHCYKARFVHHRNGCPKEAQR